MTSYVCKIDSTYGKKGDVVELEVKPDDLSGRQKVMLDEYKAPVIKASDEWEKAFAEVYQLVVGKKLHHNTKAEKAVEDIQEKLTSE